MSRPRRLVRAFVLTAVVLTVALAMVLIVVTRTQVGANLALTVGLSQLERIVDGQVSVGTIRSSAILRRVYLEDVTIADTDGNAAIRVDSLRIEYRALDLLRRRIHLQGGDLWGVVLDVARLPDEQRINLQRIFAPDDTESPPDSEDEKGGSGFVVRVSSTHVHNALLRIRIPAADPDTTAGVFEPAPDGSWLRRIEVRDLDIEVIDAVVLSPEQQGETAEFGNVSALVSVFPEEFRVAVAGRVARSGSRASLDTGVIQINSSTFSGSAWTDWGRPSIGFEANLTSDGFDPADFRFVDERLPSGTGSGAFVVRSEEGAGTYSLEDADLTIDDSRITGTLTIHTGDSTRFEAVDLTADPLDLALLEPWLSPSPLGGLLVRGTLRAEGPLARLQLDGRMEIEASDGTLKPTTVAIDGAIGLIGSASAYGLQVDANPLDYGLLDVVGVPLPLSGMGSISGTANGRLDSDLTLDVTAAHVVVPGDTTRVRYDGSLRRSGDETSLAGRIDLLGFYLPSLAGLDPMFEAEEVFWGSIDVAGPLTDLELIVDVRSSLGDAIGTARVNVSEPDVHAVLDMSIYGLDPGPLFGTSAKMDFTGSLSADLDRDQDGVLSGRAAVALTDSRYDRWTVDTLVVPIEFADGFAAVDSVWGVVSGVHVQGGGTLGLDASAAPGTLELAFRSADLSRPWLETWGSIEPDEVAAPTAQSEADAADSTSATVDTLFGRASGTLVLSTALPSISIEAKAEARDLTLPTFDVDTAQFAVQGSYLGTDSQSVTVTGEFRKIGLAGRSFETAGATARATADSVQFRSSLAKTDSSRFTASGAVFVQDSLTRMRLDTFDLSNGAVAVSLRSPSRFSWNDDGITVHGLEVVESATDQLRLSVAGRLPRSGPTDFRLTAADLDLQRLTAFVLNGEPLGGRLDGEFHIVGSAEDPTMTAQVSVRGLALGDTALAEFDADLSYANRRATVRIDGRADAASIVQAQAIVPIDLTLAGDGPRLLESDLEGAITIRNLPIALILVSPGVIDDVSGSVSGTLELSGTASSPHAAGDLRLSDGSAFFPALGVRQTASGRVSLDGRGSVEMDVSIDAGGRSRITGQVGLQDLRDPTFDLTIRADTFQVINRRDIAGQISGDAHLRGRWTMPEFQGTLALSDAVLRLDELARSRDVADVSNADFYQVVDTTVFSRDGLVTPSFADRSSIVLDLTFGGGTWLRGRELDAELTGALQVTHEPGGLYGLSGELQTVRGSYRGFGRNFQVVEGSVLFAGTETIDPILNIVTVTRIRSSDQALDIIASLQGTATAPHVTLSSSAQPPMAEEELVSYLVFGRPSYHLGSAENAVVAGVTGAASSLAMGFVANELGSALGREIGIFDYFTITAPQEAAQYGQSEALRSSIASTQVEFGSYLSENLFLAAIIRPLDTSNQFAGGRLEWRFRDGASLELFLEDRLARSPSATFSDLGYTLEQSLGMFLAKEWTY